MWMEKADLDGKRHAERVLRDWYFWMARCIRFYEENGFTDGRCSGLDIECEEYADMLSERREGNILKKAFSNNRKVRKTIFCVLRKWEGGTWERNS